ncbi:hypothetical protein SUDANB105_04202 [Streptomyces sp. enrichment culture]|uniref:hypothetical protein n=1 Tax=Streptomyces sp. enrichment culture TaxID=1795815 RepID=UPI003F57F082
MGHQLEFVEDFPQIVPDPPQAHVQFSVIWKCVNTGDAESPEAAVRVELFKGNDPLPFITSIGRDVARLSPGQTDEDTVGVGSVSGGNGTVSVTIADMSAVIPITIS